MYRKTMDTFPTQRYETKIESFDTCMIDATNQQREIPQTVSGQVPPQTVEIENQENHETPTLHQQQESQQHQQEQPNQMTQIQSNTQQSMTLTPIRLPAILDGEFFTVIRVEDTNVTVRCLQCQKHLNGNLKSTGNFLSHIKRVHPFMVDKIKCKSNQRKPAMVYIDLSADKCPELVRTKRGYRKCYKTEECQAGNEETYDQPNEWTEPPLIRRRKSEETESTDLLKISHNNSFVMEDEFDAIGRNVAAKLRNMRLDQRIIAEKLLNDILFEAQLGNLHRDSNIHV
ncbi:uncharacterized protein LOC128878694 [Hylaeus volcanicus]|uniref:uncharacterized protein LOC128878694 n=1 Tax=Hylaeus volcanicus TaxID=313075 RepID=UPI0023B79FC8|nr:uncharacterized protein LOC128878694 [Hylaeus volcanicus]XP_053983088.1 uncharacterized protein LOC128878694 [Hylaeus volcanicus]XP_053983089.1 uncharacterized protein LOC128878694 [Hylaeus volcanicus]XP_053983090.1 uncharacterized protein LOC128878694 [Hylaeus volcanicus]XP_053983091.1 uncharacterized protein LOC128878694 [Hylaeus volcanicus]